jgi:Cu-Zn family superoxide dismutase
MKKLILSIILLSLTTSCYHHKISKNIGKKAHAEIINNEGKKIGKATFTQGSRGVLINIKVKNLPTGKHGLHFHKVGTCKDIQNFKMAQGHIMPKNKPHGFLNEKGPHAGNLPNLIIDKYGRTEVELYSKMVSLFKEGYKPALLDEDGSSLMIHKYEDDHKTQPIGGSGPRIACGVVAK